MSGTQRRGVKKHINLRIGDRTGANSGSTKKMRFNENGLANGDGVPRILAIDDDRSVLRLIEKAFEGLEVELTAVSTAEEGLPLLVSGAVDVCSTK